MKTIFEIANQTLKDSLSKHDKAYVNILKLWSSSIPEHWRNNVFPVKIKWITDRKAILYVKCVPTVSSLKYKFETTSVKNVISEHIVGYTLMQIIFLN